MRIIETERLTLRDYQIEDWRAVDAYASDPEVVRHLLWGPNSPETTQRWVADRVAAAADVSRSTRELVIVRREDELVIGGCDIAWRDRDGEIGYVLRRDCWGRGYVTEVARALLHLGFRELGLNRVTATCAPDNVGSARVLEKCGMRREGYLVRHLWQRDFWRDSLLYAITEEEFASVAGA